METTRVMAMIEANSISGTAKAVLEFAKEASHGYSGFPQIDLSILTFDRGQGENYLTKTIKGIGTPLDVIFERFRFDLQRRAVVLQDHLHERQPQAHAGA